MIMHIRDNKLLMIDDNIATSIKAYLKDEYVSCNLLHIQTDIYLEEMI